MALDQLVPRYALWLHMSDRGCAPEALGRDALLGFFDDQLDPFLDQQGLWLGLRERHALRRTLERYDPAHPTPYEFMERLSNALGR